MTRNIVLSSVYRSRLVHIVCIWLALDMFSCEMCRFKTIDAFNHGVVDAENSLLHVCCSCLLGFSISKYFVWRIFVLEQYV